MYCGLSSVGYRTTFLSGDRLVGLRYCVVSFKRFGHFVYILKCGMSSVEFYRGKYGSLQVSQGEIWQPTG